MTQASAQSRGIAAKTKPAPKAPAAAPAYASILKTARSVEGALVIDAHGQERIDFRNGDGAVLLGWGDPRVEAAVARTPGVCSGKLEAEAAGILQWMLTGFEEWCAIGLSPPAKAIAAVEDYRADEDPVGQFLKARCEQHPLDYINPSTGNPWETSQKMLREAYVEWCKEEGLDPMSPRAFGSKLTGRGIPRRRSNGLTLYQGITLVSGLGVM